MPSDDPMTMRKARTEQRLHEAALEFSRFLAANKGAALNARNALQYASLREMLLLAANDYTVWHDAAEQEGATCQTC